MIILNICNLKIVLNIIYENRDLILKYYYPKYCVFGIFKIFRKFCFNIWEYFGSVYSYISLKIILIRDVRVGSFY